MKPPISEPRSEWGTRVAVGLVCAFVIAFYFWRCQATVSELGRDAGGDAYYNLLVAGFEAGQLNLKVDVPEGLAQLADPYDPVASAPYRRYQFAPHGLHDTSYFRGKLYLYFGVTPAVVLFWPYHLLTGRFLTHSAAVASFCSIGFLVGVWLLRDIARRHFPAVGALPLTSAVVAFGLGSSVAVMMWRADVWEVPIACAYMFIMVAVGAVWRSLRETGASVRWVAVASLAYALAIGARPAALPGAVILLFPVLAAWRQPGEKRRSRVAAMLFAVFVPMVAIGTGLALYNYLRFGSIVEFGQRYQLAGDRQDNVQHFSPSYLWYNFRLYFLSFAPWREAFPFVGNVAVPPMPPGHGDVDMPSGILTNMPFTLFAAAAILVWRTGKPMAEGSWRLFLACLVTLFGVNALLLCLFYGTCTRYQVEFHPFLLLLAGLGVFALDVRTRTAPRWRKVACAAVLACAGYSAAFGALKSFQGLGENYYARGIALATEGDAEGALRFLDKAIRYAPERLDPRFNAAVLAERLGRIPQAIAYLQELTRIAPHHAIARNNLGQLLRKSGRHAEAIAQFEEAICERPGFFEADVNLGVTLQEAGRHAEAVECFRRAAALRPEFAEARYWAALSLNALGRVDEARREYEAARALKPDLPPLNF